MPDSVTIDGMEFRKPPGKWDYGAVLFSPDHVLKLNYPHTKKQNTVEGEIRILEDLNRRGAISVPMLHSSGVLLGAAYPHDLQEKRYMILERIQNRKGLQHLDVLRAFIEMKSFGYLHGDLKPSNVVFDGRIAVLVDFDQTIQVPEAAGMNMEELLKWGVAHKDDRVWKQCNSLRHQLESFSYSSLAGTKELDLWAYPLKRAVG